MSPFAVRLKLLQHCLLIGLTPTENNKLKKCEFLLPSLLIQGYYNIESSINVTGHDDHPCCFHAFLSASHVSF